MAPPADQSVASSLDAADSGGGISGMRSKLTAGPLGSRNFRLLALSITVSMLGNAIGVVAQPFAVFAVGGTVADVGYAAAAQTLPTVLFLLVAGVVADRLPRHQVLATANVVQGLTQAVAAALVISGAGEPWHLVVLAGIRGTAFAFVIPAEEGLVPQTVRADQLSAANAIQRLSLHGSQVLGASTGGLLVAFAGPGWALAIDAVTFGIAAAARAGMRFPNRIVRDDKNTPLQDLREGWREFVGRQWLWVIVVQFSLVVAVHTASISVLGPLVAKESLGGARPWGFIVAATSVGAVAGAAVMLRWRPRRPLLVATVSVFADALPLLGLAVPLPVPYLCATTFVSGMCITVFGVNWATTMQQQIPSHLLSRVFAYDAFGSIALAPVATAVAGPVAGMAGSQATLLAGAVLVIAATGAALLAPEVRRLRRRDTPPVPVPD